MHILFYFIHIYFIPIDHTYFILFYSYYSLMHFNASLQHIFRILVLYLCLSFGVHELYYNASLLPVTHELCFNECIVSQMRKVSSVHV